MSKLFDFETPYSHIYPIILYKIIDFNHQLKKIFIYEKYIKNYIYMIN